MGYIFYDLYDKFKLLKKYSNTDNYNSIYIVVFL